MCESSLYSESSDFNIVGLLKESLVSSKVISLIFFKNFYCLELFSNIFSCFFPFRSLLISIFFTL